MGCCIIIPAYQPQETLLSYLDELASLGFDRVLLVDDGSGTAYAPIFAEAAKKPNCTALSHEENRGKGAAIKTALAYYLKQGLGGLGVVTVDADGQHAAPDVQKVYEAMLAEPGQLVLGVRSFGEGTPQRSQVGNRITSAALRLLYGIRLTDSQTGLRGIPAAMVPAMAALRGERYEYELNMLIYAQRNAIRLELVPIQTIYHGNNEESHFRTLADSLRIIGQMARGLVQYGLSAVLSAVTDVAVFGVMTHFVLSGFSNPVRILGSAVIARTLSSIVNYACNRRLPFVQEKRISKTIWRYYTLWLFQLVSSSFLVWALFAITGVDELVLRMIVDLLLALASYQIQMRWVFRRNACGEEAGEECPEQDLYSPFARLVKAGYRLLHPRWKAAYRPLDEPAAYIVHHQNMAGPIHAVGLGKGETHIWALHVFFSREECFEQFYRYTFTERFHWPKPLAWLLAGLISLVIPAVLRGFRGIPVSHEMMATYVTLHRSVDVLLKGQSVLLCPDVHYSDASPKMGDVYTGFLFLEKMYYKKSGRHLAFVPLYASKKRRRLVAGQAVRFDDVADFRAEYADVAAKIIGSINDLGVACGDIPAPQNAEVSLPAAQVANSSEPPGDAASAGVVFD